MSREKKVKAWAIFNFGEFVGAYINKEIAIYRITGAFAYETDFEIVPCEIIYQLPSKKGNTVNRS